MEEGGWEEPLIPPSLDRAKAINQANNKAYNK